MKKHYSNKLSLFWPLFRVTLLFMIAQSVLVFLNYHSLLSSVPVNKFIFQQVLHSPKVLIGLTAFVGSQLLLNLGVILLIMFCAYFIKRIFNLRTYTYVALGLLLWVDINILIFVANQINFSHSMFSFLLRIGPNFYPQITPYITWWGIHATYLISLSLFCVTLAIALIGFFSALLDHPRITLSVSSLLIVAGFSYFYWHPFSSTKPPVTTSITADSKPNIVLISIDYFRPGDTVYFGNNVEITPQLDKALPQFTVFTHSLSVIARTFPSLMSVESGSYPIKSGARFNLIDPASVNHNMTLAHVLQNNGYYTMLATDGSHFFYMTPDYGFNKILAPPPGLNEFLLSSINDFPLSNVVMNTFIGKYLFPLNYMNRNANVTYMPNMFNRELALALKRRPDQPLYIHIHLTLGAWPYSWSQPTPPLPQGLTKTASTHYRFNLGVTAVDQQFGQVMQILQNQGILNNAMLVVFSDHGQAFGEPGDRLTEERNLVGKPSALSRYFTQLTPTIGHGTDILSMKQYHPLLAFKIYGGTPVNRVGSRSVISALIDIAPTVLDYLHIANPGMQGVSLMPEISAFPGAGLGNRYIFTETEFTVPSILTADPSINNVIKEGLGYYNLNPKTGILQVKPDIAKLIIIGKERAVIQNKWMLAYYPNTKMPGTLVLVNLATKQWTLDLKNSFAQSAPVLQLWQALYDFYGNEINLPPIDSVVERTDKKWVAYSNAIAMESKP